MIVRPNEAFVDGHYSLVEKTAAATEPVTLTEARLHVHKDGTTDEDTYITSLIPVARQWAEVFTGRRFITTTLEMRLDKFPASSSTIIELPGPPLIVVNSIKYIDDDGDTQTWSSSSWTSDVKGEPGRVMPAFGESYPDTRDVFNAVTIDYDAGYGAAGVVPKAIKHAILFVIGHLFENREEVVVGVTAMKVPQTAERLLWPFRLKAA